MNGRKLPKNRRFNIEFQYYNPQKEEQEGRRIKFQRGKATKSAAKQQNLLWLIIILVMVFFAIKYLTGISTSTGSM